MPENYREKLCLDLMERKIESFYISGKHDIDKIEKFTEFWTREGFSNVDEIDGDLKFYNFDETLTLEPITFYDVLRSLDAFKGVKLKKMEFSD